MTIYSSRPPRNDDPLPFVFTPLGHRFDRDWNESASFASKYVYSPRPEFDRQNNPSNPILARFREKEPLVRGEITERLGVGYPAEYWAHRLSMGQAPSGVEATEAEITHAQRVLSRLATFRDQAREEKK